MEVEEWEAEVDCVECGASIHPATDAGFALEGPLFLCQACAVARGGIYDPLGDRWVAAPRWTWRPSAAGA